MSTMDFMGLGYYYKRSVVGGTEAARRPEVGKCYITICGDRTGTVYPARSNPFGATFEASIPASHWIAFYNEFGEALNSSAALNIKDVLNDYDAMGGEHDGR